MPNHLADATSPYLLQHADNPVDWFEWGDEAFAEARERDVPIFLSVGYSSCHWCHVMERESFEDPDTARLLNESFVNVKVDREERPDVDAVYMQAVTALTGHGGWPMSVFLTPSGKPFFAGTYWPAEPRHGMPSFRQVVAAVAEAWTQRKGEVTRSAQRIADTLEQHAATDATASTSVVDAAMLDDAVRLVVERAWDRTHGGFGRAPKFPQAMTIEWLIHHHVRTGDTDALEAAVHALRAMAAGGIHDQLAGGFARYSTDERWLVPHFEKMLYDNALLLGAYATAAAVTGDGRLRDVATWTADYLLGQMRGDHGMLFSSTDADSEGEEGRYFVWTHDELVEVIDDAGEDVELLTALVGATPGGNWEGVNVLRFDVERTAADFDVDPHELTSRWEVVRAGLLERRRRRTPPALDDKVLTDWNGLTVRALVVAGRLLGRPDWIAAAHETVHALHRHLVVGGQLGHTWRAGRASEHGFLEDHAALALAELEVLSATGDEVLFSRALERARRADERFADPAGGWFQTAHDGEELFTRPKETWDNATPAGSSVMVEVCLALAGLTGEQAWRARADRAIAALGTGVARMPTGFGWLLRQIEALAATSRQVAVVGPPGAARDALARAAQQRVAPGELTLVADDDHAERIPLLEGRRGVDGRAAAYVCRDMVCDRPVTGVEELAEVLAS